MKEGKQQVFQILLVDDEAADAEILLRSLEQELAADENREFGFTVVARAEGALKVLEIGRASCREECRSRWSPYH